MKKLFLLSLLFLSSLLILTRAEDNSIDDTDEDVRIYINDRGNEMMILRPKEKIYEHSALGIEFGFAGKYQICGDSLKLDNSKIGFVVGKDGWFIANYYPSSHNTFIIANDSTLIIRGDTLTRIK